MQLLPLLLLAFLAAIVSAEPVFRFYNDDSEYFSKRAPRVRELLGKRDNGWDLAPTKRARELLGKRSLGTEKRKPRELFGKRSALDTYDAQLEDPSIDYVYDEELLRALSGLKRERRARVHELLG